MGRSGDAGTLEPPRRPARGSSEFVVREGDFAGDQRRSLASWEERLSEVTATKVSAGGLVLLRNLAARLQMDCPRRPYVRRHDCLAWHAARRRVETPDRGSPRRGCRPGSREAPPCRCPIPAVGARTRFACPAQRPPPGRTRGLPPSSPARAQRQAGPAPVGISEGRAYSF